MEFTSQIAQQQQKKHTAHNFHVNKKWILNWMRRQAKKEKKSANKHIAVNWSFKWNSSAQTVQQWARDCVHIPQLKEKKTTLRQQQTATKCNNDRWCIRSFCVLILLHTMVWLTEESHWFCQCRWEMLVTHTSNVCLRSNRIGLNWRWRRQQQQQQHRHWSNIKAFEPIWFEQIGNGAIRLIKSQIKPRLTKKIRRKEALQWTGSYYKTCSGSKRVRARKKNISNQDTSVRRQFKCTSAHHFNSTITTATHIMALSACAY